MRVAILTGGGDCPGLNAAIRAVAKSLILGYNCEIVGIEDGFLGLIERRVRFLNYEDFSGILHVGGTILGTHNRASPLDYNGKNVLNDVKTFYDKLELDAIVVIGGDGTLSIAYELSRYGMNIIGVPKTIDNDLMCTDRTFGFDTATSIVTEAMDRLRTTGQSHKRVMILETMGRYTGWIALHSGLSGGADIILIPEYPYNIDEVAKICELRQSDKGFSLIVVAEGAKIKGGDNTVKETVEDSPDPIRLGGIGNILKTQLETRIDSEIRCTSLGHLQRGGIPSSYDRIFATNVGCYAASLIASKRYGRVVVVEKNCLSSVPLSKVANKIRIVPRNDMSLVSALSLGISLGDPELTIPLKGLRDQTLFVE